MTQAISTKKAGVDQKHGSELEEVTPKCRKMTKTVRLQQISHLQEKIKDVNGRLQWKEKQRDQAGNARKYRECEEITEEMSSLKQEGFQYQVELKALLQKKPKNLWYQKKKVVSRETSLELESESHSKLSSTPSTPLALFP